jgi:hypothetical protein
MFWLTPLLLISCTVGIFAAVAAARRRAGQAVLLIAAFAAMVFFAYNVITGPPFGFPKYYAPALAPAAIVALAPFGLASGTRIRWRWPSMRPGFAVFATGFAAILIASFLEYAHASARSVYPERSGWFLAVLVALVLLAFWAFGRALEEHDRALVAGLAVLGAVIVVLVATDLSTAMWQRSAPGSVRYFPGERDFALTVAKVRELDLRRAALERATLISAKDVGYESGVRYYEDDFYLPYPDKLARLLRSSPGMLMVTRADYDFSQIVWPQAFKVIAKAAHPTWVSPTGTFTIWRTNPPKGRP